MVLLVSCVETICFTLRNEVFQRLKRSVSLWETVVPPLWNLSFPVGKLSVHRRY